MIVPRFGLPEDAAQWGALAIGAALLAWGRRIAEIARRRERAAVILLALLAALLSWGYIAAYLRGGPRIIDATSYYLEARGLAEGHLTWPAGEPEVSTLGRFLVRSEGPEGIRAGVLFPPGYPLLLALGFLAGAPLAVGPLLAAALVIATYLLAREVTREVTRDRPELAEVPLIAATLSVVCGALRYHTADTMSHGLSALCVALGVTCLLRAASASSSASSSASASAFASARWALLAGVCGGWLFLTRPASGLAFGAVGAVTIARMALRGRASAASLVTAATALGGLPFALGALLYERRLTGNYFLTAHAAHYALNDGPPGCFRYGFGAGIGCYGEHGDFVRANLPHGFGALAAVKTTARRLWMHLADAANAEPLALLVPAGAALAWKRPAVRLLAAAVALQIAAYAPFYFDANYPGGGARLFADVLPIEHVLLALAAVELSRRNDRLIAWTRGTGAWIAGLSLVGFALRGGFDHAHLRDRDGGAPLFSARVLDGVKAPALVFVTSDAAYNLAFDPEAAARGLDVVRFKGDAVDTAAWRARGSPPAYVARFEVPPGGGPGRSFLEPYAPDRAGAAIEGESLWPPIAQHGAYALPVHAAGTCAGEGRALRFFGGAQVGGSVIVALPAPQVAGTHLSAFLFAAPGAAEASRGPASATLTLTADGESIATGAYLGPAAGGAPACASALEGDVPAGAHRVELRVFPAWIGGGDPESEPFLALDRVEAARP